MSSENGHARLSRDGLLARRMIRQRECVHVEEFDGDVLIQEFTVAEVTKFSSLAKRYEQEPTRLHAHIIAMACINDDGSPMFSEADIPSISGLPWAGLDRLVKAVMRLNRMAGDTVPNV